MHLVKSILVGRFFLVATFILLPLALLIGYALLTHSQNRTAVAYDPVSIARSYPLLWVLAILVFLLGFVWEHRRLKSRHMR